MLVNRRSALKALAAVAGTPLATTSVQAQSPRPDAAHARLTILSEGARTHPYGTALDVLTRYVDAHLRDYGLPGLACAITDRDGFTALITGGWSKLAEREPVRPEHLFQIGSISKGFAGLCCLHAAAEGKLELDHALAAHVPDLPLPVEKLTIRQFLTHTTGLPEDAPPFPLGGNGRLWTGYAPGSRFSYSNTGYEMLGFLLERIYDRPYEEIVRKVVLSPLGMEHSKGSIRVADQGAYARGHWPYFLDRPYVQRGRLAPAYFTEFTKASGCIAATPEDMSRYVRFLISAGSGRGAPLLSDADAVQFTTPITDAPVFGPSARYALGLGVVPVNGVSCLHHTGGMTSFSSSIHVDPKNGVGAFASTNTSADGYRPRAITYFACELMRSIREGMPVPLPPEIADPERIANAARYAGRYASSRDEAISLRAQGPHLVADIDGKDFRLQRIGDDDFVIPHPRFERLALSFQQQGASLMAWWGSVRFMRASDTLRPAPPQESLLDKEGYYTNLDPWTGSMYVFARGEDLWLDGKRLVPLPDGSYRVGDDPGGCERVRFEAKLNGHYRHLYFSGVLFQRDHSDIPTIA